LCRVTSSFNLGSGCLCNRRVCCVLPRPPERPPVSKEART
jgi:hypothetical protein